MCIGYEYHYYDGTLGKSDDSYPRTEHITAEKEFLAIDDVVWGACKGDFTFGYILENRLDTTNWWKGGGTETHEYWISNYSLNIKDGKCLTPGYIYWKFSAKPVGSNTYDITYTVDVREANKFDPPHLIVHDNLLGYVEGFDRDAYPLDGVQGDRYYVRTN